MGNKNERKKGVKNKYADSYLLDLQILLSGEEGDVLLGEIARDNEGEMDL